MTTMMSYIIWRTSIFYSALNPSIWLCNGRQAVRQLRQLAKKKPWQYSNWFHKFQFASYIWSSGEIERHYRIVLLLMVSECRIVITTWEQINCPELLKPRPTSCGCALTDFPGRHLSRNSSLRCSHWNTRPLLCRSKGKVTNCRALSVKNEIPTQHSEWHTNILTQQQH